MKFCAAAIAVSDHQLMVCRVIEDLIICYSSVDRTVLIVMTRIIVSQILTSDPEHTLYILLNT